MSPWWREFLNPNNHNGWIIADITVTALLSWQNNNAFTVTEVTQAIEQRMKTNPHTQGHIHDNEHTKHVETGPNPLKDKGVTPNNGFGIKPLFSIHFKQACSEMLYIHLFT